MTSKIKEHDNSDANRENRFEKEQPLRHPLAEVEFDADKLRINKQLYQVIVNKQDALVLEDLQQKYDPYLDQYDFLVGDVASEHLRLKGFYQDKVKTAIDRKEQTIADYLIEYCNPGGPYFILRLVSPVHHYRTSNRKRRVSTYQKRGHNLHGKRTNASFKKHRVHETHFKKRTTVAVKKAQGNHHSFVIKKRKSGN